MQPTTIKIGAREVSVSALPLGSIRKMLGAIHRAQLAVQAGVLDESLLDDVVVVLSAATGIPKDEVETLETNMVEIADALEQAIKVSGLDEMLRRARGTSPGEPGPGVSPASTPGTNSTAASVPPAGGPGSTSTGT